MMMFRRLALLFVTTLSIASSSLGCGATPGEVVRPNDPTFAGARGDKGAALCREAPAEGTPLIVDWNPEERGDLEAAMSQGVAVVSYDCKTVKLLQDCKVEGKYGFVGITKKEQVITLENADQAQANLPLHGASIGASMERGSAIDIGLVMIGKKNTLRADLDKKALGAHCEGATHYVQSATVGAFAMRTSASGAARAKAVFDIFGGAGASGQSSSSKNVVNKDGDVDACKSGDVDSTTPPRGCGAPLRIRLLAIAAGPASATPAREVACPKGLVAIGGKCGTRNDAEAFDCTDEDGAAVCEKQCDKGSAASCWTAATLWDRGDGGVPKDTDKSADFGRKACDLGDWSACEWYAGNLRDYPKARGIFLRACNAGSMSACVGLGSFWSKGDDRDLAKGIRYYLRACRGGELSGCQFAAERFEAGGPGVPQDLSRALAMYESLCATPDSPLWSRDGCYGAANLLAKQDRAKAKSYMQRACELEHPRACEAVKKM